ncbi:hypothetical protein ACJDU8_23320 [Clostridium sp. WILCCON 0269]|uniref:Uncharacterized protein n=1 Tax=Candidatus Clostridium eludens TaxID=3381663 RepID=A0ABW8SRV9_9CLOT
MIKMKYKLISAIMLAAPLLANTGIATTVHACANTQPISHVSSYYTFANFEAKLNSLVAAGTITQSQESTILNLYYNGKITTRSTFKAELDALVAGGTITQSQELSILNLFTGWGSSWYIPAPSSGGGNYRPSPISTPNGINHNTPQPNNSKTNSPAPTRTNQNAQKPSNSKQNNPKVNTPAVVTPSNSSTNNCGK